MSQQSTNQPPLAIPDLQQLEQIRSIIHKATTELNKCLDSDPTTETGLELRRLFVGKYGSIANALVRFSTLTINLINLEQRLHQQLLATTEPTEPTQLELNLSDAELEALQRFLQQTYKPN